MTCYPPERGKNPFVVDTKGQISLHLRSPEVIGARVIILKLALAAEGPTTPTRFGAETYPSVHIPICRSGLDRHSVQGLVAGCLGSLSNHVDVFMQFTHIQ